MINLKKLRLNNGLSQKELADKLGISQNHYSNIETGMRCPSVKLAKKIAIELGFEKKWHELLSQFKFNKTA